jgi:hypothetical protein
MTRGLELTTDPAPGPDDYDAETGAPLLGYLRGRRGGLGALLPDGLHLSGEAYRVLFELVKPHVGPFPVNMDAVGAPHATFPNPFPSWLILSRERGAKLAKEELSN